MHHEFHESCPVGNQPKTTCLAIRPAKGCQALAIPYGTPWIPHEKRPYSPTRQSVVVVFSFKICIFSLIRKVSSGLHDLCRMGADPLPYLLAGLGVFDPHTGYM
jgi:hypothetical protein